MIPYKVHFKFNNSLTKSEKYMINKGRGEKWMEINEKTIKSGPMRTIRVHLKVHGHLHGLTRQRGRGAQGFKSFHGNKSTFTDPTANLIRIDADMRIYPKICNRKVRI